MVGFYCISCICGVSGCEERFLMLSIGVGCWCVDRA